MSLQHRRGRYITLHMWKILQGYISNNINIQHTGNLRRWIQAVVPNLRKSTSTAAHQKKKRFLIRSNGPKSLELLTEKSEKIAQSLGLEKNTDEFTATSVGCDASPRNCNHEHILTSYLEWRNHKDHGILGVGAPCSGPAQFLADRNEGNEVKVNVFFSV